MPKTMNLTLSFKFFYKKNMSGQKLRNEPFLLNSLFGSHVGIIETINDRSFIFVDFDKMNCGVYEEVKHIISGKSIPIAE